MRENPADGIALLIAARWNPLMERLKAIGSLRDLAQNPHISVFGVAKMS